MPRRSKAEPSELKIWTYQVGFGDCFLLEFIYADQRRYVLVDFGTTGKPKGTAANLPVRIAQDIKAKCGGKLDAVVATHRHKDHISGFATAANGKGSGDIIASLKPKLVIQPWTEHPRAQPGARSAPLRGITKGMRRQIATLGNMHDVALSSAKLVKRLRKAIDFDLADEVEFLGDDNLKNDSAVKNLARMGRGGKARYVHYGEKSGLEAILPGVKVRVLGPPTLEQSQEIENQRERDPEEFWHFWGRQGLASRELGTAGAHTLFPRARKAGDPQWARWFRRRVSEVAADSALQLVRILDEAMNNTSVILLFEVGGKRLLFPGDAQIENWLYALSKPEVQRLLRGVDVYKVGHHGSLNATPKTKLWEQFSKRSRANKPGRLVALLSTMPGKHGSVERATEVPRRQLLAALNAETTLVTTTKFKPNELVREHSIVFGGRTGPRSRRPA